MTVGFSRGRVWLRVLFLISLSGFLPSPSLISALSLSFSFLPFFSQQWPEATRYKWLYLRLYSRQYPDTCIWFIERSLISLALNRVWFLQILFPCNSPGNQLQMALSPVQDKNLVFGLHERSLNIRVVFFLWPGKCWFRFLGSSGWPLWVSFPGQFSKNQYIVFTFVILFCFCLCVCLQNVVHAKAFEAAITAQCPSHHSLPGVFQWTGPKMVTCVAAILDFDKKHVFGHPDLISLWKLTI